VWITIVLIDGSWDLCGFGGSISSHLLDSESYNPSSQTNWNLQGILWSTVAPQLTQPGDLVCILFGGQTQSVLRREQDHILIVGETYVHGIMYREAITSVDLERETRTFEIR
jgi:hypothetical protein